MFVSLRKYIEDERILRSYADRGIAELTRIVNEVGDKWGSDFRTKNTKGLALMPRFRLARSAGGTFVDRLSKRSDCRRISCLLDVAGVNGVGPLLRRVTRCMQFR